jgi:GNAT superfamily N-acetyltransferase
MLLYKEVSLQEMEKKMLEIDVSEHGSVVFYWLGEELRPVPEEWERPRWTQDGWRDGGWTIVMNLKGVRAWGAFDDDRMVGIIVYRPHLTDQMAQLAALFVSNAYRRKGIASRLTEEVVRQAKMDGFAKLYVSATPSESAVNFYRSQGFVPTRDAHPELYALEPDDIHMIKEL